MRWFPLDIEKGIGTGYLDYEIGRLSYDSGVLNGVMGEISFVWEGLKNTQTL